MYIYKVHVTNMLKSKMYSKCELTLVNMRFNFFPFNRKERSERLGTGNC